MLLGVVFSYVPLQADVPYGVVLKVNEFELRVRRTVLDIKFVIRCVFRDWVVVKGSFPAVAAKTAGRHCVSGIVDDGVTHVIVFGATMIWKCRRIGIVVENCGGRSKSERGGSFNVVQTAVEAVRLRGF